MIKQSLLIALLLLAAFNAESQVGLSASPMTLQFNAPEGGTQNLTILVSNPGKGKVNVGVSLSDWKRDSMGAIQYAPSGTLKNSCTAWLKILPATSFTLGPSEQKRVMVLLKAPDSVISKTLNTMVFFTQLNPLKPARQKKGINILLTVKLGVQIFYTPPGISKKAIKIADFDDVTVAHKDSVGKRALALTLVNTGATETDGKVNLELNNLQTGEKIELPEKKFYTLPGAVFKIIEALPAGLKAGTYSATALVDYGADYELKIGELQFKQR